MKMGLGGVFGLCGRPRVTHALALGSPKPLLLGVAEVLSEMAIPSFNLFCQYQNRDAPAQPPWGKARETVMKAAAGLESKRGLKNSKLYNANYLMMSVYCGNERALCWQSNDKFWRGES